MKTKKRTKQVEKMVEEINVVLKNGRVIDEYSSDVFWTMQFLLIRTDTYRGYNWFYEKDYTDVMGETCKIERLCGTSVLEDIKAKDGYLQFY